MKQLTLISLLMLTLNACMLNPQVIRVDPTLTEAKARPGSSGTSFRLLVQDQRDSYILGQRGSDAAQSGTVKSEKDISAGVQQKLSDAFTNVGFTIDDNASNQLVVNVVRLNYLAYGSGRVNKVEVSAEINASAVTADGNFSKQYKARHSQQVLKAPGKEKNEEIVNKVLGAVVQRVLDDEELLQYLNN